MVSGSAAARTAGGATLCSYRLPPSGPAARLYRRVEECGVLRYSLSVDEGARARAERRRKTWRWGVASGAAAMEDADLDFWLAATPEERVSAIFELDQELRSLKGDDEDPPRLQRALGGVRRRGS